MGSRKIKKGRFGRRRRQIVGPAAQGGGVPGDKCIEQQRRQGEIINHPGLVPAVAEIADVFMVRDVGLGDQ